MARIAVVGGGLAGLASASLLARDGHQVTLLEGKGLGGMADSVDRDGYRWNWGGHALYRGGAGTKVLRSLGVQPEGFVVKGAPYMHALRDGRVQPAPFSPRTAMSPIVDTRDRLEFFRVMGLLPGGRQLADWHQRPLSAWLDQHVTRTGARDLVQGLVRLSSFTNDPARQSAATALSQLQLSRRGVWYLHHGWRQLVDGLRAAAAAAGVQVREHARVEAVSHDTRVRGVRLAGGEWLDADAAVLAVGGPRAAAKLLDGPAAHVVHGWERQATPVRAATWELNLDRLPSGAHPWVLGLDHPVYINVHSHFAQGLAPEGGAMVHVLRYLGPEEPSDAHRGQMSRALDAAIPGWADRVVGQRFLPALTVMHDTPHAATGGLPGRPGPLVDGVEGLAVTGDWIGRRGILADAALASAATAASALTSGARTLQEAR